MVYASNPADKPFDSPLVICRTFHATTCFGSDPNPLSMVFPHPFIYEDATTSSGPLTYKFTLLKGLKQPWPYEIQSIDRSRWITNNLKKWVDYSEGSHSLLAHLNSQFLLGEQATPITPIEKSPLNSIRQSIKKLFLEPKCTILQIQRKPVDLFRVLIHQPIVISPTGGPMLIATVYDLRMVFDLKKEKRIDNEDKCEKLCQKLFMDGRRADDVFMEFDVTPEEIFLWRYMFHVNSTKMIPTLWQKEKVPIGMASPWTVTFISPLYLDSPFEKFLREEVKMPSMVAKQVDEKVPCAACKKVVENRKRCSRCRVVFYCSVECQRRHWSQHKPTCAKKRIP